MAYTSGGTIQAIDYNYLAWGGNSTGTYTSTPNNLSYVWGVGYGMKGYGQDVSAFNAVTGGGGDSVTATQWAGLVYTVNKALAHQSGSAARLASGSNIGITAGATITAFANVSTSVTTINTNANTASALGTTQTGTNLTNAISGASSPFTSTWTRTVTFASSDQARYFFNSGGYINVVVSAVSNNGTTIGTDEATMITTYFGGFTLRGGNATPRLGTGGTTTTSNANLGFWALNTGDQVLVQVKGASATYTYNLSYFEVKVKCTGAAGTNGGLGSVITFTLSYIDSSASNAGFNDAIDITVTQRYDVIFPETTYLNNVWGTVTVA